MTEADRCCHAVQDKVWVDAPDVPLGAWEFYTVLADDPGDQDARRPDRACCATSSTDTGAVLRRQRRGSRDVTVDAVVVEDVARRLRRDRRRSTASTCASRPGATLGGARPQRRRQDHPDPGR